MPSATVEPASPEKKDRKSKREKGDHKSKKRNREAEGQTEEERGNKRSKSEAPADEDAAAPVASEPVDAAADAVDADAPKKKEKRQRRKKRASEAAAEDEDPSQTENTTAVAEDEAIQAEHEGGDMSADKASKKQKKKRHGQGPDEEQAEPEKEEAAQEDDDNEATADEERKRRKKEKKEKKRREKEQQAHDGDAVTAEEPVVDEVMDLDGSPSRPSGQAFGKLPEKPYPFFTQKVSQYLPLFPSGMVEPIEGYADQHLKPLLNHYVPAFKGVLLGYNDVEVGEAPGRGSITEKSEDADEAMLESIDEYAVCFGWLTAKLDLFKPSRGAWMEGTVNMQTEGHLGVVCWGMFNASIEAGRLPKGWLWISLLDQNKAKSGTAEETFEESTPEPRDEGEDDMTQMHTTGYWVDDKGQRVRGTLRFQIKNFEVGVSGDYGYLSIEGTMLDEDSEKKKVSDEMEKLRRWKLKNGASRREMKRLPDFSITKFNMEAEEEDESKRAEIWKGSRPGSETAE